MTRQRIVAGALAALVLAACGSNDPEVAGVGDGHGKGSHGSTSSSTEVAGVDTEHNDADVAFIADMTPHHAGAVEMAELAETRAANPQVKDLAARIAQAQAPEIERMARLATAWGVDVEQAGGHGQHGAGDAAALEPLTGAAFDREFLIRMIDHHEGALPMSRTVLADGENPQARELAEQIIRTQEAEIVEMNELLNQL